MRPFSRSLNEQIIFFQYANVALGSTKVITPFSRMLAFAKVTKQPLENGIENAFVAVRPTERRQLTEVSVWHGPAQLGMRWTAFSDMATVITVEGEFLLSSQED